MAKFAFHPSLEGAQHGAKTLEQFLAFAKKSGATGAQPSNYMLQSGDGFKSAAEVKAAFSKAKMKLDGISAHCPFWVHTTAWTGSPTVRPFLPPDVSKKSPAEIEKWAEDYLLRLLDAARAVDAGEIAKQCSDSREISAAVQQARTRAIEELLEK